MDIRKSGGAAEGADPLVNGVVKAREFFSKNGTIVTACCAAAVILVGGALIYNSTRESGIRKAQEIFGVGILDYNADRFDEALATFSEAANTYRNTPIGAMSAFMMGSIYLQQGNADQAATWFGAAVNAGGAGGFVKGQALEGLAAACEEKGDAAAAVKNLERALRDKKVAHRHPAIRWKLALLNKDNPNAASAHCKALIADTLAGSYHQKAENFLAALNAAK